MPGIPLGAFVSLIPGVRCTKWASPGIRKQRTDGIFVSMQTAAGNQKRRIGPKWQAAGLVFVFALGCLGGCLFASVPAAAAQSSASQTPSGKPSHPKLSHPKLRHPRLSRGRRRTKFRTTTFRMHPQCSRRLPRRRSRHRYQGRRKRSQWRGIRGRTSRLTSQPRRCLAPLRQKTHLRRRRCRR